MKLIDLLVQELPKRGGWPDDTTALVQNSSGYVYPADGGVTVFHFKRAEDWELAEITREQYEAAIASTQRCVHEWIPSEGRTESGVLCRNCGDDEGPRKYEKMKEPGQPVWDGEGLPPVGVQAEVSVDGGRSWCSYKATRENNGIRLVEIGNFTEEFQEYNWMFRPIPTEADKKREIGVTALAKAGGAVDFEYGRMTIDGELSSPGWYELYDKIAAGEVAGIRIE
ncbi:hypothetical protein SM100_002201 [Cronobacter sakazakii]|nr:hypothetical protein [Cronobacter sakazakii]